VVFNFLFVYIMDDFMTKLFLYMKKIEKPLKIQEKIF